MLEPICERSLRATTLEILGKRLKDHDDVLVEELLMPDARSRIDVALVNGHVEAFELKSDHDNLKRLPLQRDHLARYFDRLTIVCTTKHVQATERILPAWWGLVEARRSLRRIVLKQHRKAAANPEKDLSAQLSLLWREDLEKLARGMKNAPKKPGSMTKPELCQWISGASPGPAFMKGMRSLIKSRVRQKLALR